MMGGRILGQVDMGNGNDTATFIGIDSARFAGITALIGGPGNDVLVFDSSTPTIPTSSIAGWESIGLRNASVFTLDGDLVLGDTGTRTGSLEIDGTSALIAPGDRRIVAFDRTSLVTVTNAGLIQIAEAGRVGNTFTVAGNYVGQDGAMRLNTTLGGSLSPTDRFVLRGGDASGRTSLQITNVGGAGALTLGDGIRVVQASDGARTAATAFYLGGRVAAGAFEYQLFRGGASGAEDWFLRSALIPQPPVPEEPQTTPPPAPLVPLYRPEVALYAGLPEFARQIGFASLATLHERVGEEENIRALAGNPAGSVVVNGSWARIFGHRIETRLRGDVPTRSSGDLAAVQAGVDIIRHQSANGYRNQGGIYVGYANYFVSPVRGFALGIDNLRVGRQQLEGPMLGGYWTLFGPSGWYIDAVVQAHWFNAKARSDYDTRLSTDGYGLTTSLEVGYPINIRPGWIIEPQAQIAWQRVSIDGTADSISRVAWNSGDAVIGRVGARLQHTAIDGERMWQPYARVNIWHVFSGTDRMTFGSPLSVGSDFGGTTLDVNGGLTARLDRNTTLFAQLQLRRTIDGNQSGTYAYGGSFGFRMNW
jgi:outer membrane autotransporter protein